MKVIVNADDLFGYDNVNEKIIAFLKKGIVTQSTAILTMPEYFDKRINEPEFEYVKQKIGLHVSLTRGHPLSLEMKSSSFVSSNWLMNTLLVKKASYFYLPKKYKKVIIKEVAAQMEKYKALGFSLLHFDSHGNYHCYFSLYKIFIRLGVKYGFKSVRISYPLRSKNPILILLKKHIDRSYKKHFKTVEYSTLNVEQALVFNGSKSFEVMTHPSKSSLEEDAGLADLHKRNFSFIDARYL